MRTGWRADAFAVTCMAASDKRAKRIKVSDDRKPGRLFDSKARSPPFAEGRD